MNQSIGSISLDLDNQWSYMKIHGDHGWESFPSYLDTFVPYVLKVLDDLNLNITFFIVGQDAALDKNKEYLQMITDKGHDVGNHSFHHESWLHTYSKEQVENEIIRTEEHIERLTGKRTYGFRGPGFSWSPILLEVLSAREYLYDASTLPTYIGPLARLYYFWTANLSKEEKEERKDLFGSFRNGRQPVKPYYWKLRHDETILEIPVTTIPIIKTPFHFSYLLYLSGISHGLMNSYLNIAIRLCKMTKSTPSYLLHPLDLIGGDHLPQLKFFPGMDISSGNKIEIFTEVMNKLKKHFQLVNMTKHARQLKSQGNLPVRELQPA